MLRLPLSDRPHFAEQEGERLAGLARRAAALPGVTVIVNELVIPYERAWGNLTRRIDGSLNNVIRRINTVLRDLARHVANVHTVDCDHLAACLGKRTWFDERLWFHGKCFCHPDALPQVAGQALDIIRVAKGKPAKCIVLDLDNTLWGGIIGDDGLDGIRLGELGDGEAYVRFQTYLHEFRERGIILAVCSKNDDDKARSPFREHPDMVLKEDDIACFVANWNNKADNIRLIAQRLNIGLDSMVFLDDSQFERNLVRQLVPEVCVPELPEDPAEFVPYLEALNLFESIQFSAEDRARTEMYRANVQRQQEQEQFTDVNAYLASLQMTAAFERFDDYHMPRIAQLVGRTNQFNLTTIRHPETELRQFADDPDAVPCYASLEDRFGDNGLVSVVIGRRQGDRMELVTWLMSCRVIARRLEEFVLDRLVELARDAGIKTLAGRYVPTNKNALVAEHYPKLGFRPAGTEPDGTTLWELTVADHAPSDAPIKRKD